MPHMQPGYILLFLSHDHLVREKLLRSFSNFTIEEIEEERSDIHTSSVELWALNIVIIPRTSNCILILACLWVKKAESEVIPRASK